MSVRRPLASDILHLGFAICLVTAITACDSGELMTGAASESGNEQSPLPPLDIAAALGNDAALTMTVELNGSMVLPVAATRETARADVVFDRSNSTLFAMLQTPLEQPLEVHIHEGGAGEVGAAVATLYADSSSYTLGDGVTLTARQAELLQAGNLYIDVHTAEYPQGLLRAQLTEKPVEVAVQPLLDDIQAKVFTPICSGCHTGGGQTLPGIMDLTSAERSYESLVGVYSINEPSLLRVDPGNAAGSLLFRKIEGTHAVGSRMPLRGSKLDEQSIFAIRIWIANGAAQ